jgi:LysM repeat protein
MKQRDKLDTLKGDFIETLEADLEVDFSDEEGYSVQSKNKKNGFAGKPPGKRVFSFLAGALAVVVIFLIAGFFLRTSNVDSVIKLRSLENRVKQLENRSSRIDWIEARLDQIEEKNKQFTTFMDTFRKLEAPPKISTAAQTSEKQTKAVYHKVVAGETLYGISRRYGLTVDELRRLNKLEPEATIYPAQRLLISPADNQ